MTSVGASWLATTPATTPPVVRPPDLPVVSPFAADAFVPASPATPRLALPVEETPAPDPAPSFWKKAAVGLFAAFATAGALAAVPSSAPIATVTAREATVPARPSSGPSLVNPPAARATESQRKAEIADRMLSRGRPTGHLAPATRDAVREQLQNIPMDVLQVLDQSHVRVIVLNDGETLLGTNALRTFELSNAYGDGTALRQTTDSVRSAVDARYGPKILSLERQLAALRGDNTPQGRAQRERLQEQLDLARYDRSDLFYKGVYEATSGRVDQQDGFVPAADALGLDAAGPLSLVDVARIHGARTPQEIQQYTRLLRGLNADERIQAAQDKYATESGQRGSTEASDINSRPLRLWRENIVVPAYDYAREGDASSRPVVISSLDAISMAHWNAGQVEGQYFYEGDANTLVVHARNMGPQAAENRVLVHEMGHAYEDAVSEQAPRDFSAWTARRNADFTRMRNQSENVFPSEYAARSAPELSAETFADHFDGRAHSAVEGDPQWRQTYEEFLQFAPRLASKTPPPGR